ncbi:S8 family serine peptidase [Halalkalibacterium ligniniphilum]|uniref:S8 family serine peptidase n=1 Tax=Halalkalibacterium ligniniphilum TaxID=1134413 RepID=UPI000348EE2B|nr:S8 family serine peptidase [Halalkalibacterium ligniniphilum]
MKYAYLHKVVLFSLIFLLSFSGFTSAAANTTSGPPELAPLYGEIDTSNFLEKTVIVELKEESLIEAKHRGKNQTKEKLKQERRQVIENVQALTTTSEVGQEYDYVFSGFSVALPANEIPSLLTVEGVKAVYPDVTYQTTAVDEGKLIEADAFNPNMLESASFIGSNTAWEAGFTGRGVTVAIIDTGVDYTHPDLRHAFGDYKGWDFVDNDNDPQETPVGDPRGRQTNHGTHVAGTVAANGLIKGVAPEANLLAYRVLGPGGSGTTANVVAGIERAVQDGADIMNLSLGNSLNNPDFATSIALDWAMAEGVVAVTSNGNSGPNNWTVGSPGTSRSAISVGATQLPFDVYHASIFTSEGVNYPSAEVMGYSSADDLLALSGNEYDIVYTGLGYPEDFEGIDFEGKIALIQRGEIPFTEKAINAAKAGAVGVILFNNVAGVQPTIPGMKLPTVMLTREDGEKMLAELEAGNNTVTFTFSFAQRVGETVANFSSRGPVMGTWMIKPDVVAPGVNITSTVPTHQSEEPHGYAALQGTSMASPHVAGAAALLLEAHPRWGVDEVKAALMNTSETLTSPNGERYAHNTQGSGSIRVPEAINTKTLITPGSHSFGTFTKKHGRQTERQYFTIRNLSNERKAYSFDVTFVGNPEGIKVNTSNNLRVQPNRTQKVNFNVQVDTSKVEPGYYEGTITIGDGIETIEVPTILFVSEPDYPRITSFGFDVNNQDRTFTGSAYLPNGAERFGLWIYSVETFEFVGEAAVTKNTPQGFYDFTWDLTLNGKPLASGQYHVFAYATKAGQLDYLYGGELTVGE